MSIGAKLAELVAERDRNAARITQLKSDLAEARDLCGEIKGELDRFERVWGSSVHDGFGIPVKVSIIRRAAALFHKLGGRG